MCGKPATMPRMAQGGVIDPRRRMFPWEQSDEGPPPYEEAQQGPPPPMDLQRPPARRELQDGPPPPDGALDAPPPMPQEQMPSMLPGVDLPPPYQPPARNWQTPQGPPPMQATEQGPPPTPKTDDYFRREQAFQSRKEPGKVRQILAAVAQATVPGVAPYISGRVARNRELENLKVAGNAANEEQQGVQQQIALQNAKRQAEVGQSTIAANLARANRPAPLHNVAPGNVVLGPDNKPVYTAPPAPPAPQRPVSVAPGGTLVDPATGRTVFSAPARETPDKENPNQWTADLQSKDPTVVATARKKLDDMTKRQGDVARAGAQARSDVNNIPSKPIERGTREFNVAQKLAYGQLTMPQFRSLTAYSRDTNKKMDIFDKASELNPNFNPAAFEMGYKLASNPKVQQQLASMDNVEAGVDDLLKASDAATRSGITALNKFIVPGGIAIGGRKYSNLHAAQIGFADELSGALGFGSATDMSRQMGLDMTNPNLSPENFRSAVEEVVVPFIKRKRSTLLQQMGVYGQQGMNPAAGPAPQQQDGGSIGYQVGADHYDIPSAREADFLKAHPNAVKK